MSADAYYPYAFDGEIVDHDLGTMRYTVIFLPDAIAARLPLAAQPRLRFSGEIEDTAIAAAWQPVRGRWCAMLSKRMLRETGLAVGDRVHLRFRVEPPDSVEPAPEIERLLESDPTMRSAWLALTAGQRRGQTHRLLQAKTTATRAKRLAEIAAALRGEAPWPGPPPRRKGA